jgi:hypothetical protein
MVQITQKIIGKETTQLTKRVGDSREVASSATKIKHKFSRGESGSNEQTIEKNTTTKLGEDNHRIVYEEQRAMSIKTIKRNRRFV